MARAIFTTLAIIVTAVALVAVGIWTTTL